MKRFRQDVGGNNDEARRLASYARRAVGILAVAGALLLTCRYGSAAPLPSDGVVAFGEDTMTSGVRAVAPSLPPDLGPVATPKAAPTPAGSALTSGPVSESEPRSSGFDARSLIAWFAWGAACLVVLFLVFWGRGIAVAVARRREYSAAQVDPHPSVEERFTSELATMQVALLRSSAQGFYEKAYAMVCQILKSRRLLDQPLVASDEILAHLRSMGVDAAFLDCVESIMQRCDAVRFQGARPDQEAHARLVRDLGTLIRMRPTAGVRRAERKGLGRRAAAPAEDESTRP